QQQQPQQEQDKPLVSVPTSVLKEPTENQALQITEQWTYLDCPKSILGIQFIDNHVRQQNFKERKEELLRDKKYYGELSLFYGDTSDNIHSIVERGFTSGHTRITFQKKPQVAIILCGGSTKMLACTILLEKNEPDFE